MTKGLRLVRVRAEQEYDQSGVDLLVPRSDWERGRVSTARGRRGALSHMSGISARPEG